MTLDLPSLLAWLLVGMLAGAIAAEFLSDRGYSQRAHIGIGILGGLLGGLLLSVLSLQGQPGQLATTAGAIVGAGVLTALARARPRRAPA